LPIGAGDIGAPVYWRTEAPLRHYIGAPRHPCANILALRCPLRQYIGARVPRCANIVADRTQKMEKNVRILNKRSGEIIRCANKMERCENLWQITVNTDKNIINNNGHLTSLIGGPNKKYFKKEALRTFRCASPIFIPIAY